MKKRKNIMRRREVLIPVAKVRRRATVGEELPKANGFSKKRREETASMAMTDQKSASIWLVLCHLRRHKGRFNKRKFTESRREEMGRGGARERRMGEEEEENSKGEEERRRAMRGKFEPVLLRAHEEDGDGEEREEAEANVGGEAEEEPEEKDPADQQHEQDAVGLGARPLGCRGGGVSQEDEGCEEMR